ncbi:3-oxoacyl-[acyl-carrier-protein] synthase II, chloroplastic-like protein, partial [Tanacetum coccineum]
IVLRRAGDNFQALFTDGNLLSIYSTIVYTIDGTGYGGMGLWQEFARAYSVSGFCDTRWSHFIRVRREVSKVVSVVECVVRRIKAFALCGSQSYTPIIITTYAQMSCRYLVFELNFRRVVVTGNGVETPIGRNPDEYYNNMLEGKKALADGGLTEYGMDEINKTRCGVLIGSGGSWQEFKGLNSWVKRWRLREQ